MNQNEKHCSNCNGLDENKTVTDICHGCYEQSMWQPIPPATPKAEPMVKIEIPIERLKAIAENYDEVTGDETEKMANFIVNLFCTEKRVKCSECDGLGYTIGRYGQDTPEQIQCQNCFGENFKAEPAKEPEVCKMFKYRCDACGDAEGTDFHCVYENPAEADTESMVCPISGEECEWQKIKEVTK